MLIPQGRNQEDSLHAIAKQAIKTTETGDAEKMCDQNPVSCEENPDVNEVHSSWWFIK